jgi:hypothetical protein
VEPEVSFFFYWGALICFVLAAIGEGWRYGGRTRRGLEPSLALLPFGLALAVFPTLWNTGELAF